MRRIALGLLVLALALAAGVAAAAGHRASSISISSVVDVSGDLTAQNETPIAVNPADPTNMIVGSNDWNPNNGCGVNATTNGGATWTPTVPYGFLPGITRFTNDPDVPGDGIYEAGGDPSVAFSHGGIAYYSCLAYDLTGPFHGAILVNRSYDGGATWQQSQVSTFTGKGVSKGSYGQAVDHDDIHVDPTNGDVYVTWAQFNGQGAHTPVYVGVSHDQGATWTLSKITAGPLRANEDPRVVTDAASNAYLVFDSGVDRGRGMVLYASKSVDGGLTWSAPVQFAALTNPVCIFPPYCFNLSGPQFRAGGSYPAPAFDLVRDRLDVAVADIRGQYAQIYLYSLKPDLTPDLTLDYPTAITSGAGDRFTSELSAAPDGRLDLSFYDRSYSNNSLVDLTYATSSDGGHTWQQARVTLTGFDPSLWGVPGGSAPRPFIGDYNGIASTSTSAVMAWTGVAPPSPYNLEIEFATATP